MPEFDYQGQAPVRRRWALVRSSLSKREEIAYFLAYTPLDTAVQKMVRVAGMRWQIEECFQAAKNECSLDQYEVRQECLADGAGMRAVDERSPHPDRRRAGAV